MRIGVLTSGGDAQGMNPALRAVVRRAIQRGASCSAIREGYAGLVAGEITPIGWLDVSYILHKGGTDIGTARCAEFRTLEGRQRAAENLMRAGIDRLAIIGGDGSLTGADTLRREWSRHVQDLLSSGRITPEQATPCLYIVGMTGSIDNDMWGTSSTIGSDSALNRIVDAVDTLTSTASSHQRSFVVEVMGRRCGYLAAAAAVATGADFLLIPEAPVPDWRAELRQAVLAGRQQGRRKSIVLLAEGAISVTGEPITAAMVKAALEADPGWDTRVTVLGHVQRGGAPSSQDRVLSTRLGVAAVDALLAMTDGAEPLLMTTAGASVSPRPLMHCVAQTHRTGAAIAACRFDEALADRGPEMTELLDIYRRSAPTGVGKPQRTIVVANLGAPAPGMNAALQTVVRLAASEGVRVLAAQEGLRGLAEGKLRRLSWHDVDGLPSQGATILGTNRWLPEADDVRLEAALAEADGLILVGGFACLTAAQRLRETLPVVVVPATISNNVPATDRSIGSDTACNVICEAVDRLKQSAVGSRDRVFVVEVMGRRCGYLAWTAGMGSGAEVVYTHEQGIFLSDLIADIAALQESFTRGKSVGIVLVADGASDAYDTHTLARIYGEESGGRFDTRVCVLGHLQQGGRPSPGDRVLASRLARVAVARVLDGKSGLVGEVDGAVVVTALAGVTADSMNRRPLARRVDGPGVSGLAPAVR